MLKKVFKYVLWTVFLFGIFFLTLNFAITQQEKKECRDWQKQGGYHLEGFYIPKWAKAQCDHYNIIVDAPIK